MRASSSHMNGGSHKLNSWWDPPFMWEEETRIYGTPGVPNNFPKFRTNHWYHFCQKKTIDILHYAFHFDINRPSSSRNLKEAFLQLNIHTFYQKIHTFFNPRFFCHQILHEVVVGTKNSEGKMVLIRVKGENKFMVVCDNEFEVSCQNE